MEEMRTTLTSLTGAVNRLLEQVRLMENRLGTIERSTDTAELNRRLNEIERLGQYGTSTTEEVVHTLAVPRTEEDLKSICRLPDSVKELRTFDGNPLQYVSWVHSVEMVLKDFEIVKDKPIYRTIMQSIRQKVIGEADTALVSYNIFDSDWKNVKKILSLHYADKRDVQTLEHQLNQLSQGSSKVDEFYSTVNNQLSLIINKIKTDSYSEETISALISTHRNRALDIFIRGLNPALSRMVIIQRPRTLPEAYSACLELQNLTMRNNILHSGTYRKLQSTDRQTETSPSPPARPPRHYNNHNKQTNNFKPNNWSSRNINYNYNPNYRPVPYLKKQQIKYEPMEVDRSVQSRNINYMNRPSQPEKGNYTEIHNGDKQARLFHLEANCEDLDNPDMSEETPTDNVNSDMNEHNFMEEGHQAYLT